jgi:3-oxoacyl-ACP reductase-like protein
MMSLIALALLAGQTAPAPTATPAPAPTAPAAAPAAAGKFTLDTPIETIEADAKAKEVLAADLGMDVAQHPAYDSFKSMSLNQVAPMSGGKITDDVLKKIATDLAAIQ